MRICADAISGSREEVDMSSQKIFFVYGSGAGRSHDFSPATRGPRSIGHVRARWRAIAARRTRPNDAEAILVALGLIGLYVLLIVLMIWTAGI
jgi:hypothetical protein